jgi:flagellar protein FliS
MTQSVHDAYVESEVALAGPVQLIRLLYQGATGAVRDARRHLAAGEIAARSRAISRAVEILTELANSLDRNRGGEIAERLGGLYDYMQRRLLEANFKQADEPLEEVLGLLTSMGEAWRGVEEQVATTAANLAASPWAQAPGMEAGDAAGHTWSL